MNIRPPQTAPRTSAFTMVEIAICLAIIGLALVAIIGVLPLGMNVQRDNREETVINQDASIFMESIRNGARTGDDLTNYVFAITNFWTHYGLNMSVIQTNANGYSYAGASITQPFPNLLLLADYRLTNNARIIGLLSTPEFLYFTNGIFVPTNNLLSGGYSNHIVAYVRALSGPAVEKPPQDNALLREDSFTYRLLCVNAPVAVATNVFYPPVDEYARQLAANLHELRISFFWPVQPNGADGPGRQTQRAMIAGTFYQTNDQAQPLFYYQSQSFNNVP
jgi:type II secretory pathway pseudopilin PulG